MQANSGVFSSSSSSSSSENVLRFTRVQAGDAGAIGKKCVICHDSFDESDIIARMQCCYELAAAHRSESLRAEYGVHAACMDSSVAAGYARCPFEDCRRMVTSEVAPPPRQEEALDEDFDEGLNTLFKELKVRLRIELRQLIAGSLTGIDFVRRVWVETDGSGCDDNTRQILIMKLTAGYAQTNMPKSQQRQFSSMMLAAITEKLNEGPSAGGAGGVGGVGGLTPVQDWELQIALAESAAMAAPVPARAIMAGEDTDLARALAASMASDPVHVDATFDEETLAAMEASMVGYMMEEKVPRNVVEGDHKYPDEEFKTPRYLHIDLSQAPADAMLDPAGPFLDETPDVAPRRSRCAMFGVGALVALVASLIGLGMQSLTKR